MTSGRRQLKLGRKMSGSGDASSYGLLRKTGEGDFVTIPIDNLSRHICIFGRTGVGKSVTAKVIASELLAAGGTAVVILDRTGEFARSTLATQAGALVLTPGLNLTISPFGRRSDSSADDLEQSISLMHHFVASSFRGVLLTTFQERALRDALRTCYAHESSRLSDVLSQLEAQGEESRDRFKGWAEGNQAVISRLTPLAGGALANVFDTDVSKLAIPELFTPGVHIVNLGALYSDEARNMLSQILCKLVMDHGKRLGETKGLRFLLIVDEAQHIAPSRRDYEGILERYANEFRKFGMGLLVVATRPTQVSEDIIANSNAIVCHSLTSAKDTDLVLNYMVSRLEVDSFVSAIRKLGVGECLVQLNDASASTPTACKVGLPEHVPLFNSLPAPEISVPTITVAASGSARLLLEVPEDDSAQEVFDKLPPWARKAAKFVHDSGGSASAKVVQRMLDSRKKLKQMVHGRHPLLAQSGNDLVLTKLGEKIAAISRLKT